MLPGVGTTDGPRRCHGSRRDASPGKRGSNPKPGPRGKEIPARLSVRSTGCRSGARSPQGSDSNPGLVTCWLCVALDESLHRSVSQLLRP